MKSLISERITYSLNLLFFISTLFISSSNIAKSGDKSIVIFFGWFLLVCYFVPLTIYFYRSNFMKIKRANQAFKWISVIPGIYLFLIIRNNLPTEKGMLNSELILFFGCVIWFVVTIINILIKNKHASNINSITHTSVRLYRVQN